MLLFDCYSQTNPGIRETCLSHEYNHIFGLVPLMQELWDCNTGCEALDVLYAEEIVAYGAGTAAGELLYQQHCSESGSITPN